MGGLLSCNQLAHIEELVEQIAANSGKPSYSFGRGSTVNPNTWLFSGNSVPSNKTGIPFGLNNGEITYAWVGNELLAEYDVEIYHHTGDETNLTLLTTLNISSAARTSVLDQSDFGIISVPKDVQLAVRIGTTVSNPRNVAVHLTIQGTT